MPQEMFFYQNLEFCGGFKIQKILYQGFYLVNFLVKSRIYTRLPFQPSGEISNGKPIGSESRQI